MAEDGVPKKRKAKKKPVVENGLDEADGAAPTNVRGQTKAKFNQLLQQAMSENKNAKSGKKKKAQESMALKTLKQGEAFRKDGEDESILANTYDPDDHPKSTKSNKRRQRMMERSGTENPAYEEETETPRRIKNKKNKNSEDVDRTMTISELAPPPSAGKKKKKKRTPRPSEDEDAQEAEAEMLEEAPDVKPITSEKKAKKTKKKKKDAEQTEEGAEVLPEDTTVMEPVPARNIEDDGRVLGITVHRTDKLKTDFFIAHPLVRIHIVDAATGSHVKKQHRDRAVTWYYERKVDGLDYILPVLTQPYDFKKQKSTLPMWEELVIFNENYNYFLQQDPKVMIFFEILDFISMNAARQKYNVAKQEGGWHRVAWAFLKVLGSNGHFNTDKKLRLQLFQPPFKFKAKPGVVDVYQWWLELPRVHYPSTLYVTVKGIRPPNPDEIEPAGRSMFATQKVCRVCFSAHVLVLNKHNRYLKDSLLIFCQIFSYHYSQSILSSVCRDEDKKTPSTWSRLAGQACKVPNNLNLTLPTGRQGCFVLKFSPDGRKLACGCHDKSTYPILVYEIPSGQLKGQFLGHYSIIYDLCWTKDSKSLLSASSDATARIWNIQKFGSLSEKLLPHPAFVYTAQFHPRVPTVVVTGGYDKLIRIWNTDMQGHHAELVQELEGQKGFINTICFDEDGQKMFSGDSIGTLRVWNVYVTEMPSRKGVLRDWSLYKEINDEEYEGTPINYVTMHPGGRRLLVHCRDNTIRMIDLRIFAVMQRYIGALNFREQIRSTISQCGTFVVSGSEDYGAYVWNAETGDQVAMYTELNYKKPVTCVDFHPHDNMVAFASFGENNPVLIYIYDHQVAQLDADIGTVFGTKSMRPRSPTRASTMKETESQAKLRAHQEYQVEDSSLQGTARLERVKKKLEAVTASKNVKAFQAPLRARSPDKLIPGQVPSTPGQTAFMDSTWGHTFDQSTYLNYMQAMTGSPAPQAFSPHATTNLSATMQQQQFASQMKYQRQGGTGWRPQFGAVGRQGAMPIPYTGRPPQIALNATQGKPQFSFQPPPTTKNKTAVQKQVKALYDYQAQRSDELSLVRGDIVTVLYKDSENWWMGELLDGQQGFFPSNYVAEIGAVDDGDEDEEELNAIETKPKKTTAVKSASGDLKFVSETEDSEQDTPGGTPKRKSAARRRRRDSIDRLLKSVDDNVKPPLNRKARTKVKDPEESKA
ncbi:jouberin [Lingula anatina]|uniref:Jouberin n=1 Tax=Lingula anatina TaxID=7574 RepID=A0A1S3H1C7_LINAN|nr:jouberin [Lingula anatina]|eukprot:XP_013379742.1 jouberin [Lingula anatina]